MDPSINLAALAASTPPIVPQDQGAILTVVSILFAAVSFIVVVSRLGLRVWLSVSRSHENAWGWDDILAGIAMIPFQVSCAYAILGAYYGVGVRDTVIGENIPLKIRAAEYVAYFQINHALCVPFIKASIAISLMRISSAKRYHYPLYFVILASTVLCLAGWISLVTLCKPTAALWNPQLGTCGDYDIIVKISYVVSIVTIITDWTCAIIPFFMFRKLQVSFRTKLLLLIILGMGVFASVAAILRYPWLQYYDAPKDSLWYTSQIILWCVVESGLGMVAGSLPALHKFRTIWRRHRTTNNSGSGPNHSLEGSVGGSVALDRISKGGKHSKSGHSTFIQGTEWDRLSDDAASGKHIVKSQEVHITHESAGAEQYKNRSPYETKGTSSNESLR